MLPARHGLPLDHHDHNNNNYHNNDNSDAGNDDNDNADNNNNNNNATNANQSWDWKTTNTVWLSALQHFYNATTKLPCCNIQQQLSLVLNTLTMTIPMVPPPILSTRVKSASVPAFSSWEFGQNWNPSWIHNEFSVNKALLSEECFFAIVYLIIERLVWKKG